MSGGGHVDAFSGLLINDRRLVAYPCRAGEVASSSRGKRFDFNYGDGQRWIEVAPAGSAHRIALVPKRRPGWLSTSRGLVGAGMELL